MSCRSVLIDRVVKLTGIPDYSLYDFCDDDTLNWIIAHNAYCSDYVFKSSTVDFCKFFDVDLQGDD